MATFVWLIPALLSSLFAGVTAVIAKIGLKKNDSDCVTALRTLVVLLFAWLMVWIEGSDVSFQAADRRSIVLLLFSGLATGGSWLCYFKALSLGSVQHVAPVDKSSIVLTMLFGALLFHEDISSPTSIIGMILIVLGMVLMLPSPAGKGKGEGKKWLGYAIFSAVFASASALLGKAGIEGIDSYLGTAVRTSVVLLMAWLMVLVKRKGKMLRDVRLGSFGVIALSGVTTGISWLCYYRALQTGPISIIAPIDRLSIVFTVLFSAVFLREKLTGKLVIGLAVNVLGTLLLLL